MLRSSKLVSNDSFDIRCGTSIVAVPKDRSETSGNRSALALSPHQGARDAIGLQSLVELFGELTVRRAIAEESAISEARRKRARFVELTFHCSLKAPSSSSLGARSSRPSPRPL